MKSGVIAGRQSRSARSLACFVAITILAPVTGVHASGRPVSVLLSVEPSNAPLAGARVFAQKNCVRCHALVGKERQVGPDLGRVLRSGTVLDLAGAFWNHSPVMREKMRDVKIEPPTMSSSEMADLLAFLSAYRNYLLEISEQGNPSVGRGVFVRKRCAECHADDQTTSGKSGPSLAKYRRRFSASFLAQAMWNHGPEMSSIMRQRGAPWPKFGDHEMGHLIAYLQVGSTGSDKERVYFQPGSPRRGRELISSKRCIVCHSVAGKGGQRAPDLGVSRGPLLRSVSEIAGTMWNHGQGMVAEFRRRGIERVTFSGRDMVDIIAYLYFVNYTNVRGMPARGSQLFASKCATCHPPRSDKREDPKLAAVPRPDNPIDVITAMWNHAQHAAWQLPRRGLPWPRLGPTEAADLAAFLLTQPARSTR